MNNNLNENTRKRVYEWLANFFNTSTHGIEDLLSNQNQIATAYLLIWPVMEQTIYRGFMQKRYIRQTAREFAPYYNELNIDIMASDFHERYRLHPDYYRHLKHGDDFSAVDRILDKPFFRLSDEEKLVLMIYVVYRYRNNIFHGSKGIASWSQFSEQINNCIEFMMAMVDCYEKHKEELNLELN